MQNENLSGASAQGSLSPAYADDQDNEASQLRMKTALDCACQGVWDYNFETKTRYVSAEWGMIRGIPKAELDASLDAWLNNVHPDDRPRLTREVEKQGKGDIHEINYQYRERHRDGHWIWILSRGRMAEWTDDGLPRRVIGTDTDISDIKDVETAYARTSERLQVALDAAHMGRWEYSVRDNTSFWDDRLMSIFGVTDGQALRHGEDWLRFVHPDDLDITRAKSMESYQQKDGFSYDYRIIRPDGQVRTLRSRAKFVRDPLNGDGFVGVIMDVSEDAAKTHALRRAKQKMKFAAMHDALTGLKNRRGLDDAVTKSSAAHHQTGVTLMHFDLDQFKQINDTLGHAAGDAVLVHTAAILKKFTPDGWTTARVGGDEFVIFAQQQTTRAQIVELCKVIIAALLEPFYYDGQLCNFGTSIGVFHSEGETVPVKRIFVNADLALYEAKRNGRGCYRFYNTAMSLDAAAKKDAYEALRRGVSEDQFICYYQPQVDAKTLDVTGFEALIRWQHPERGLLLPEEFLDNAAQHEMLAKIDHIALERALADHSAWKKAGTDVPRLAVNVSLERLSDPNLIPGLAAKAIPRDVFAFELLETVLIDAANTDMMARLDQLRELGISIEIDDFGSGHASIMSLIAISPDQLKIDGRLVAPIVKCSHQRALIDAIVKIGHMQGTRVVAEGVETLGHAAILQEFGCDTLQGFAFSKPIAADKVPEFLNAWRNRKHSYPLHASK